MKTHSQIIPTVATLILAVFLVHDRLCAAPSPDKGSYSEWERGYLGGSHDFYVPCLDETFLVEFELPYMTHRVWTPNGGFSALFKYMPHTPHRSGYITLTGYDSGRIFYMPNGAPALNETLHIGPGEVYRLRSHERYISDDGLSLTLDWQFRFTINAAGELIADIVLLDCNVR